MQRNVEATLKDLAAMRSGAVVFGTDLSFDSIVPKLERAYGGPVAVLDARRGFERAAVDQVAARVHGAKSGCVLVQSDGAPSGWLIRVLREWAGDSQMPPCVVGCDKISKFTELGEPALKLFPVRIAETK
jgi:hypothetical protein